MQLKLIMPAVAILASSLSLNAQSKVLQAITADATASATNKVVGSANKTVNQTLDKLLDGSIFKKKIKNKTDAATTSNEQPAANTNSAGATELTLPNIDYSSIVALADVIKINKSVTDVQRSFSNGSGVINVTHTCKTEELLDDILKNTAGRYEVAELNKGKITLKAKK